MSTESSELLALYLLKTESVLVHARPGAALDQVQKDRWRPGRHLLSEQDTTSIVGKGAG